MCDEHRAHHVAEGSPLNCYLPYIVTAGLNTCASPSKSPQNKIRKITSQLQQLCVLKGKKGKATRLGSGTCKSETEKSQPRCHEAEGGGESEAVKCGNSPACAEEVETQGPEPFPGLPRGENDNRLTQGTKDANFPMHRARSSVKCYL